MPSPRARTIFERAAATYDAARWKLIPPYERFYETAAALIPSAADQPIRVLDLGAGTGLLAAFVRARFPKARLHLIDASEKMLVRARERLGDDNVSYAVMDYRFSLIPPAPHGGWNAIVSALSIHHLTDRAKRNLVGRIYAALAPAGVFINAEQVAGPTSELTGRYRKRWLAEIRARGATDKEIADAECRMTADRCTSVARQLMWMQEAGFTDADCWFKDGQFAVLAGTRTQSESRTTRRGEDRLHKRTRVKGSAISA